MWNEYKMKVTDRNACMESFQSLCDEVHGDANMNLYECQYWVFERGYRAAVQELMTIAETGVQVKKFVSPKLQSLAERLIYVTDCV
jgi:hypothetical protein